MIKIFNKKTIFLMILFFIISFMLIFWKFLSVNYQDNSNVLTYEEMIKKTDIKKSKNVKKMENFIIKNKNIYGTLTAMHLSKQYVLLNNLDKAIIQLNNSLKYTKEENLKNILILRIVKIKMQKNNNKEAMNMLKNIKNNNWNNIIEDLKGDIFLKIHNTKEAIKSWKKSNSIEKSDASKAIINMKINEYMK